MDQNDEIGKFLTLKREETHQHIRQGRNNNRATRQDRANRMKPPAAIPSGGSVGSAGTQANANGGTNKDVGAAA